MRRFIIVTLLTASAWAQTSSTRISPEEAARHVLKSPDPPYPPLAAATRIQGNVILELRIDESGAPTVSRLVSGHPMLAPAAIEAVKQWKYKPFVLDGKPTVAKTLVMVTFGQPANHGAADSAEMVFQNNFWTSEEAAEAAMSKGDFPHAEEHLSHAGGLVSSDKEMRHIEERWQWMTTLGRLRMMQQKYGEAEQLYKNALSLRENSREDRDSPRIATSLANLAVLYAEEKKIDMARDHATRALAIFQKNFKKTGSGNPGAKQAYGRAAAQESWLLIKLARERSDSADAERQCRALAEFQSFLGATDQEAAASACEVPGASPGTKP